MKWLEGMQCALQQTQDVDLEQLAEDSGYRGAISWFLTQDTEAIPLAMRNRMKTMGLNISHKRDKTTSILVSAISSCNHCNLHERCLVEPQRYHHLCPNNARFDKLLKIEADVL